MLRAGMAKKAWKSVHAPRERVSIKSVAKGNYPESYLRPINNDIAETELAGMKSGYKLQEQTAEMMNDVNMDMSEIQLRGMKENFAISKEENTKMLESRAGLEEEFNRNYRNRETLDQRIERVRGASSNSAQDWVQNQAERDSIKVERMSGDRGKLEYVADYLGISPEKVKVMNQEQLSDVIRTQGAKNGNRNPTLWDRARYHRIPEAALGVGVAGGLVLGLSGNRGRQSNGQLYGQQ